MLIAILLCASLSALQPSAQSEQIGPPPEHKEPAKVEDAAFDALVKRYEFALREYNDRRVLAARESNTDAGEVHPARTYFPSFTTLAEDGSGSALGWLFENLRFGVEDPQARQRTAKDLFARLFAKHADEEGMLSLLAGIGTASESLGDELAIELCQKVMNASTVPEIQARALFVQSQVVSDRGRTGDQKRIDDARELQRSLLYAFPETTAAKEVSGIIFPRVEQKFLEAEQRWLESVRALHAAGKTSSEWPRNPVHEMLAEYLPLAAANHMNARYFVDHFQPEFEQAERQGPGIALTWLVDELGRLHPVGAEGWTRVRTGMLQLLYEESPGAPWVYSSLQNLAREASGLPPALAEQTLAPLLANSKDPTVRALVLYIEAQSHMVGGDSQSYARALELLKQLVAEYPREDIAKPAARERDALQGALPGATASDFKVKDTEGTSFSLADYRGRVVVLDFWGEKVGNSAELLAEHGALLKKMGNRPFSLVGLCIDRVTPPKYYKAASELGINWRNTLLLSRNNKITSAYAVRSYPTTIVIDADGVIRGRSLPKDEFEALVERLVAEAERKDPVRSATPLK